MGHLRRALQACLFPTWVLNKLQHQFEQRHNGNRKTNSTEEQCSNNHNSIVTNYPNTTTAETSPWWYPTYRGWERSLRGLATNRVYMYISIEQMPSNTFSWHQNIRTINLKKWGFLQIEMLTYQLHRRVYR